MKLETSDRTIIAISVVTFSANAALVIFANVYPGPITVIFSLITAAFMVQPIRRQRAVWNFDRAHKRADRLLVDSNRALDETSRWSDNLRHAITEMDQTVENAQKEGGLAPGEYDRLLEGLEVMKRRMLAAHKLSQRKGKALKGISGEMEALMQRVERVYDPRNGPTRKISQALTKIAVFLVGSENSHLGDTWNADLAGVPEEGYELSAGKRIAHASGFIYAAFRIRTTMALQRVWKPVDWLLVSNQRVNSVITALTGIMAIYLSRDVSDLLNAVFGPCGAAFLVLKAGSVRLRQVRGIELEPMPKKGGSPGE